MSNPGTSGRRKLSPQERRRREYLRLKKKRQQRMRRMLILGAALILLLMLIGLVITVLKKDGGNEEKKETAGEITVGERKEEPTKAAQATVTMPPTDTPAPTPTPEPVRVTIAGVGDDLIHTGVFKSGERADGTRNYDHLYAKTAYLLENVDVAVMNQETIFAGNDKGLSSYPSFNSPVEITDALVKAGYNVITHATNHALDMGIDGILYSAAYWKANHPETLVLGIHEDAAEQNEIPILEIKGIKFAMLNYTYGHNWETFAKAAEGHLDMLCAYDATSRAIDFNTINPKVLEDIKKAEEIADFTIIFPHWGTEYVDDHTSQQENFAKLMTKAGADLIIGTHPHVIEPVVWIEAENGNRCLCYYSLGNYTSTQDEVIRLLGAMAKLTVVKDGSGTYIDEESVKAIPLVTHYTYPGNLVAGTYSLANYTEELAAAHGLYPRKGYGAGYKVTVDKLRDHAIAVLGDYCSIE